MSHFKSNVRDLEFNLFEVLGIGTALQNGNYEDLDAGTVRAMLTQACRLAEGPLADSFVYSDRNPPIFDPEGHRVQLSEPFKSSVRAVLDGGWDRLGSHREMGGASLPGPVLWAVAELMLGANPVAYMFAGCRAMVNIFYTNATAEQKKWALIASEHNWSATMVLTEPDAGSDVGAGRTKAIEQNDGSWHIEGVKRFITFSDADDLFDNILHLVLARPEGAGPGTKGLSLFVVPKYHFDTETGELGDRNGVFVTNVEHKMGYKGGPTCELTFGLHDVPAAGWLVGEVHEGIAQMFDIIENARMTVGVKATATLSTGYLNALAYAKQRVQGADLTHAADPAAPRVTITHHPDVRRNLALQKAYTEGLRAVYLYTAAHQDPHTATLVSCADLELAARVNDLLLPIVKGVSSERAYEQLAESLQVFGGSGYLQDYPIEQYIRDAKIDTVYEGTTAIQAQDFFFRKIARDRGVALAHVTGEIATFIETHPGNDRLKTERALLATALEDIEAMTGAMTGYLLGAEQSPPEIYKVGLGSVRYLLAVGDLLIGWRLLVAAQVSVEALEASDRAREVAFYRGKIAVASFFAKNVLPRLTALRGIIASIDNDLMELDEAAF